MILVTGANGNLGSTVIDFLLKKNPGESFAGMVRSEEKAKKLKEKGVEVRIADYNRYSSLTKAFKGVDKLYFVSSSDVANRGNQHANVVRAASEAGVKHIFYTSVQRKREDIHSPVTFITRCHLDTEKLIVDSGIPYTILKHALYMEILPMFIGQTVVENGSIYLPAGNGSVSYALRSDMAEVSAHLLTSTGHENKVYEIAGNRSYSFYDIADSLTRLSGRKISYLTTDAEQYRKELYKARIPADMINTIIGFSTGIKEGEFDCPSDCLTNFLGREAVTPEQYLKQLYLPGDK